MKVSLTGPMLDNTGFCWATRSWARALAKLPVDLFIIPMDQNRPVAKKEDWKEFEKYFCRPYRNLVRANKDEPTKVDVAIFNHSLYPKSSFYKKLMPKSANRRVWAGCWEASMMPPWFTDVAKASFDEMISPSKFIGEINPPIKFTGAIPYVHENVEDYKRVEDGKVIFYTIAQNVLRKNLRQTVRCFCKAFNKNDNVELIIKLGDQKKFHSTGMVSHFNEVIADYSNKPDIGFLFGNVSNADMVNLHKTGDIFFMAQHAEGWGIPHVEALLYGNPLVSNAYSSIKDFADETNSFIIPHHMTYIKDMASKWNLSVESKLYDFNGGQWAEMTDNDVIKTLHRAYKGYKEKRGVGPTIDLSMEACKKRWLEFLEM